MLLSWVCDNALQSSSTIITVYVVIIQGGSINIQVSGALGLNKYGNVNNKRPH